MPSLTPFINVLATDFCNHSCPFCFARKEMVTSTKKEFDIEDYKLVIKKCKAFGCAVALSGGEPTLHSQFPQILKLALKSFFHVPINTGGMFTDEVENLLYKYRHRIGLYFNISTPGFVFNKITREKVLKHIRKFAEETKVILVVTSKFFNFSDVKMVIDFIEPKLAKKVTFRIGVEGCVAGEKNYTTLAHFPTIGQNFFKTYTYLEKKINPAGIRFAKSLTPCMFTPYQKAYLKKRGFLQSYFCHPESEQFWFSITPQMQTYMCYPLLTNDRGIADKSSDFIKIKEKYAQLQVQHHARFALPECKKCPFFGLEEGKCPGPCLGFKINASLKQNGIVS